MGIQRWLPTRSHSESMSKSRHDHVDGGYTTRAGDQIALDQNYISWLVSYRLHIENIYIVLLFMYYVLFHD